MFEGDGFKDYSCYQDTILFTIDAVGIRVWNIGINDTSMIKVSDYEVYPTAQS